MRALFVCARNRLRSPTAEAVFGEVAGLECASAGTAADAECVLDAELVEWADAIFVMERRQARWVKQRFSAFLEDRRLVCLDIRDVYTFMQAELVALLRARVEPWLQTVHQGEHGG